LVESLKDQTVALPAGSLSREEQKRVAAVAAADLVESGMTVGLGSGSTAGYFIEELGVRLRDGRLTDVVGIPTSHITARQSREAGITTHELTEHPIDIAVDGADQVGPELNLIKGAGGALLREKLVASAAETFVVVVDQSKLVPSLGTGVPIPLEVARFGHRRIMRDLEVVGIPRLRLNSSHPVTTDNGQVIIDLEVEEISDPVSLDGRLARTPGVLATGLFVGLVDLVLVGEDKEVRRIGDRAGSMSHHGSAGLGRRPVR